MKTMARKPMVTRAFKGTRVVALALNTKTREAENVSCTLASTYPNADKLLKAVRNVCDNDELKVVSIVDSEEVETLYGMDVQKFIENSVILDNETRKEIVDEEAEDEE